MFLKNRHAAGAHQRHRALRRDDRSSRPNGPLGATLGARQKAAPALSFQALLPALVALPRGLVGELEMKGDD
jgi:hypothetical protein